MWRRLSFTKASLAAVIACLALTGGGCGGGSDSQSSTQDASTDFTEPVASRTPSKSQFIKQASAICVAAHERSSEEFAKYVERNTIPPSGPGMIAKAQDVIRSVFEPVYELQIEKISKLGAPRGDRSEVTAILTAIQEGIERAKQEPLQFIRHASSFDHASRLATAYGLSACGTGNA